MARSALNKKQEKSKITPLVQQALDEFDKELEESSAVVLERFKRMVNPGGKVISVEPTEYKEGTVY